MLSTDLSTPLGQHRFWSKVDRRGPEDCWNWLASKSPRGYGSIGIRGKLRPAHQVAYELLIGPIPDGTEIDHKCRNHSCVNPSHLEPVTHKLNILRGESPAARNAAMQTCQRGHPLSGSNVYRHDPRGGRRCRICTLERNRRSDKKMRQIRRVA